MSIRRLPLVGPAPRLRRTQTDETPQPRLRHLPVENEPRQGNTYDPTRFGEIQEEFNVIIAAFLRTGSINEKLTLTESAQTLLQEARELNDAHLQILLTRGLWRPTFVKLEL